MPHRIRLRKPWQGRPAPGGVDWRRPFNRPTGLGPAERVWVAVQGLESLGTVELNGHQLGRLAGDRSLQRFEATAALELHNELLLRLETSASSENQGETSPPAAVWLEIVSGNV